MDMDRGCSIEYRQLSLHNRRLDQLRIAYGNIVHELSAKTMAPKVSKRELIVNQTQSQLKSGEEYRVWRAQESWSLHDRLVWLNKLSTEWEWRLAHREKAATMTDNQLILTICSDRALRLRDSIPPTHGNYRARPYKCNTFYARDQ